VQSSLPTVLAHQNIKAVDVAEFAEIAEIADGERVPVSNFLVAGWMSSPESERDDMRVFVALLM
jgi:hypothetical protein